MHACLRIFIVFYFLTCYSICQDGYFYSMNYRKKKCEVQTEKQNYQRHLNRLKELRAGHSPQQIKRNLQQHRLIKKIEEMRKIHTFNRNFHKNQMKSLEKAEKSKQKNYHQIKSIVKQDISKLALSVASKHKKNQNLTLLENQRILQRLLQVKSNLNFSGLSQTHRKVRPLQRVDIDFTDIYQQSKLNTGSKEVIHVQLGKKHRNLKLVLELDYLNMQETFREMNEVYAIDIVNGSKSSRICNLILGEVSNKKISIHLNSKAYEIHGIQIKFSKIMPNKEIIRGIVILNINDFKDLLTLQNQSTNLKHSQTHFELMKPVFTPKGTVEIKSKILLRVRKIDKAFHRIKVPQDNIIEHENNTIAF